MEVFFNSSAGRIQGEYHCSPDGDKPVALILHSHPEGSMNDTVVCKMYKHFVSNGFSVLKINFRGIDKSQGRFDQGIGELVDASTALDWLEENHGINTSYWVAGFAFGARIGMELTMRRPEVMHFVVASPPVNKYDFSFLSPCPVSGLVLQGDLNSVVPRDAVLDFVNKTPKRQGVEITCRIIEGADHLFRNRLDQLGQALDDYIQKILSNKPVGNAAEIMQKSKVVLLD